MASMQANDSLDGAIPDTYELPRSETFEVFYRREKPGLIALARALSGAPFAEDLAQDAMVTAFDRWDQVAQCDSPAAWVRRVCANRSVSLLRRRAAETRALRRLGNRREGANPEPMSEDAETFWAEVRRLPRRQAQSVALFYIFDLSVDEIARTLDCAPGTVKVHLSRGRATLARRLGESSEEGL